MFLLTNPLRKLPNMPEKSLKVAEAVTINVRV